MSISNPKADSGQAYRTIFLVCDYSNHSVSSCGNYVLIYSINTSPPNLISKFFRLLEIDQADCPGLPLLYCSLLFKNTLA